MRYTKAARLILLVVAALGLPPSLLAQGDPDRGVEQNTRPHPALDPEAAGPAKHVWSPTGGQEVFFRRKFSLPEGARDVCLVASCDDECTIQVDGEQVAEAHAWEQLIVVELEEREGDRVVAVRAGDRGGAAALALWVVWKDAAGEWHSLVTDREWRCHTSEVEGWQRAGFDDTGWVPVSEQGATPFTRTVYGMAPVDYVIVDRFSVLAERMDRALQRLRNTRDRDVALRALGEIERAVVEARADLWKQEGRDEKPR